MNIVENIVKLVNEYAGHKKGCTKLKVNKMFDDIKATAKDCGNQNVSLGGNIECSCGFSKLVKEIGKV